MTDELEYAPVEGWQTAPAHRSYRDAAAVGVNSQDQVLVLTRGEPGVMVYDSDGSFVASWGEGFFSPRTHGLTVAPDGTIYCVDDGNQAIYHFDAHGNLLNTIGTPGVASDTGYAGSTASITHGGAPFNRPTNLAVAPNGELYASDGYGNSRVHRFSPSGELLQSWGEPGGEPGNFRLVHGIAVTSDGRVMVADRENDRIQFFTADGEYLQEWTDVQRPTNIALDADGRAYVSELWRRPGDESFRLGPQGNLPGRVSVYETDGTLLARWGGVREDGLFTAPHDIAVDSRGDVYVAEVVWSFTKGAVPDGSHTLQKFTRVAPR